MQDWQERNRVRGMERKVLLYGWLPVCLLLGLTLFGLYQWRIHSFDRTIATIERIWEGKGKGNAEGHIVTFAELTFTRTTPAGKAIACRHAFEIGTPRDGYVVGDRLEIVPARGTCQRVDVIGRARAG